MRLARTIALTVAGGLPTAVVLFPMSSWLGLQLPPSFGHVGGVIGRGPETVIEAAGFDLWTGNARGETITYEDLATGQQVTETKPSPLYGDRAGARAIPLPVGFTAGCLLTLGAITVHRRRRTASSSAVTAA